MIRVLIVDDSPTVRKAVADRLRNAGMEVVGEAADGDAGVALTHELHPAVVLMDVVMPRVDGLSATRRIMTEVPTPIIVLSAHSDRQEVFKTYDALAAGALEVCAKPVTGSSEGEGSWDAILRTIRAAVQIPMIRLRSEPRTRNPIPTALPGLSSTDVSMRQRRIVVIGASTGGPAAVCEILRQLPPNFPLPVLVAIHCSGNLPVSIAAWFAYRCPLNVRDANDGESIPDIPGTVIVAPPNRDLMIHRGRVVLRHASADNGRVPCVDELFTSAAESHGESVIGVLLTGMGADGAAGLKRIRDGGGHTIAQDEDSCVVFGMPAAAIKLGGAERVIPLREIPHALIRLAGPSRQACESIGSYS